MRVLEHPDVDEITVDGVLGALADPLRRTIVRQLRQSSQAQTCSYFDLPVGKSTQTHHFRVLREAGIINQEYRGTAILSRLRLDALEQRMPGLLDAVLAADPLTANAPGTAREVREQ